MTEALQKAFDRAPDLGVRNAILRGAPNPWKATPDVVGPAVLVQAALRGSGLLMRFEAPSGVVVTRDLSGVEDDDSVLCVPLLEFLVGFRRVPLRGARETPRS